MKNVGLVGLGFIGKTHLAAYNHIENARVKVICTKNKVTDEQTTGQCQASFVTEYDDLLRDQEIDIIDICLPTHLHEQYIIKAANAGKHIICEKPLTLTLDSASRIMAAVKRNNVHLFVAHVLRFWPEYKTIKSYSQSDKLKNIEIVHAKRLGQVPAWSSWFQYPEKSGGALYDLHLHDIDFVYYLLGEVNSVYAVGNKNRYGAWDHVMTTLSFKNGGKAFVEASQRMPAGFPFTMSFRAQTSRSTLDFHVAAGENIENINESNKYFVYCSYQDKAHIETDDSDPFQNELSYFVNCVENNQDNDVIPLMDVLYTLKVLQAIEVSLKTGDKVRVMR
ncbi:Gfo/Idh/MocA family protein [Peribacillus sp. SCS-155]|uniref:Gfo/Idh/MocA family protein n=1 Tax=Peribacillus sedimenti TaxID=3115297 RepID=UPI003905C8A9